MPLYDLSSQMVAKVGQVLVRINAESSWCTRKTPQPPRKPRHEWST